MATLPPEIVVGPHTYTVQADQAAAHRQRGEGQLGHNNVDFFLIEIDPDRPETGVAETVIHEVLHACWRQAALNERDDLDAGEEHAITALAPLLLGLIRNNPELVAYLQG